jgi:hypothetical protein
MKKDTPMMSYMQKRNAMQLESAPKGPVKKMMPKEEAEARKKAFKEKFGRDYSKPASKPAPKMFKSQKEKDEYFKNN